MDGAIVVTSVFGSVPVVVSSLDNGLFVGGCVTGVEDVSLHNISLWLSVVKMVLQLLV